MTLVFLKTPGLYPVSACTEVLFTFVTLTLLPVYVITDLFQ